MGSHPGGGRRVGVWRAEFHPLAYVRHTSARPTIALGEDLSADPVAAQAIQRASRTGLAVLVGPLRWSPGTDEKDQLWGIVVPVFGGASVLHALRTSRNLGEENAHLALRLLEEAHIPVIEIAVGGQKGRKLIFHSDDGSAWIRRL